MTTVETRRGAGSVGEEGEELAIGVRGERREHGVTRGGVQFLLGGENMLGEDLVDEGLTGGVGVRAAPAELLETRVPANIVDAVIGSGRVQTDNAGRVDSESAVDGSESADRSLEDHVAFGVVDEDSPGKMAKRFAHVVGAGEAGSEEDEVVDLGGQGGVLAGPDGDAGARGEGDNVHLLLGMVFQVLGDLAAEFSAFEAGDGPAHGLVQRGVEGG